MAEVERIHGVIDIASDGTDFQRPWRPGDHPRISGIYACIRCRLEAVHIGREPLPPHLCEVGPDDVIWTLVVKAKHQHPITLGQIFSDELGLPGG